jgi:hypothetical protein
MFSDRAEAERRRASRLNTCVTSIRAMASRARIVASTTELMATRLQRFCFRNGWLPVNGLTSMARGGIVLLLPWLASLAPVAAPAATPTRLTTAPTTSAELVLGQSAPLSGPSAQLGRDDREGAMTVTNRR